MSRKNCSRYSPLYIYYGRLLLRFLSAVIFFCFFTFRPTITHLFDLSAFTNKLIRTSRYDVCAYFLQFFEFGHSFKRIHSLAFVLTHLLALALTHSLTFALTHLLSFSLTRSLTIALSRNSPLSLSLSHNPSLAQFPPLSRVCCLTQSISLPLVSNPPRTFWQSLSLLRAILLALAIPLSLSRALSLVFSRN